VLKKNFVVWNMMKYQERGRFLVCVIHQMSLKAKQSDYRPGQALRVPGVWRLPDFKKIGT